MNFQFYQLTSAGDRETNQDYMAHMITEDYALLVVADGLGGHTDGEKASRFFCEGLLKFAETYRVRLKENPSLIFSEWLDDAVHEMQILFAGDTAARKAYTTCAILYLDSEFVLTAHCGDSRIYRLNSNEILWRTRDHSITQLLVDQGYITEQEMAVHPEQNQLTRSINALKMHEAEINVYPPMQEGETFIVCSDGFWETVKQDELVQLAQLKSGSADLRKLARLSVIRANGKSDNVTVQWLRLTGSVAQ
ncbi:MAG: PP2C family serine/threonine-protein phosphatase [Methylococcales bacterium]